MTREYPSVQPIACFNGLVLKIIAAATMLIDHIGAVLFPGQMAYRAVGRIAFPIFVFLLVEGFIYTNNVRKYELRLLIFALISEVPFDLAFYDTPLEFTHQNAFFTLFLGIVMLDVITTAQEKLIPGMYDIILELVIVAVFVAIAFLLKNDYTGGGILMIYAFYKFRDEHLIKYFLFGMICLLFYKRIELYALLAVIPLLLYNGRRGFRQEKGVYGGGKRGPAYQLTRYLFYIFYPAHLLALHIICTVVRL